MPAWLALAGSYLIGSLDFAVVVAQAHGVDIHRVGSGNPGASNVLRSLGRGPAVMVFFGDALKGVIAAAIGYLASGGGDPANQPLAYLAGTAAVLGHVFPVFHRFRGGKGVATAAGVLLFTVPPVALAGALLWGVIAKLFKVASIASLAVVVLAVPAAWLVGARGFSLVWLGAMLVVIVLRHLPNIRRMLGGAEERVPT